VKIGVPLDPPQEQELEEPLDRAREALGPRWDELVASGSAMSVEEAVEATERLAASPTVTGSG
jgi:hypothetical protein